MILVIIYANLAAFFCILFRQKKTQFGNGVIYRVAGPIYFSGYGSSEFVIHPPRLLLGVKIALVTAPAPHLILFPGGFRFRRYLNWRLRFQLRLKRATAPPPWYYAYSVCSENFQTDPLPQRIRIWNFVDLDHSFLASLRDVCVLLAFFLTKKKNSPKNNNNQFKFFSNLLFIRS